MYKKRRLKNTHIIQLDIGIYLEEVETFKAGQ